MEYTVGKKINVLVEMKAQRSWTEYFGYRASETHLYKMQDEEGNVLVWKTGSWLKQETLIGEGEEKEVRDYFVREGDTIRIKATVKALGEYKGEKQIELQRVKVEEIVSKALTEEEKAAIKKEAQIASLKDGDFVWVMPYKQFKEHYADCETLEGSFVRHRDGSTTIEVIIRDGRLKASGVRGKYFSGYQVRNIKTNEFTTYRAVSEENAIKRAKREFGGEWICEKVYVYDRY